MRRIRLRGPRGGFTLIEVLVAFVIVAVTGLALVAAVIFSRQAMEINKQRLAAMSYCRQALEAAATNASIDAGVKTLVPFNAPGLEIQATVTVNFYPVLSTGAVDWNNPLSAPPAAQPALCKVDVTWVPPGSWKRQQNFSVSMSTIVRAGTT